MESTTKPTKRTRDASAFVAAPVVKPSTAKTRARYTALQQSLLDREIPPRMVRYITQHFHAKAKVDAFIDQYRLGCHLTGKAFSDRYDSKNPKPDACVPRKDGTLVCLPIHLLSQEGKISDGMLLAAARALVNHAHRRPAPTRPTPPPTTQPAPEPTYAAASFLSLEPGHQDHSQPSDPIGQPESTSSGHVPVTWSWCDHSQAMVGTPIESVSHAQ